MKKNFSISLVVHVSGWQVQEVANSTISTEPVHANGFDEL